MRRATLAMAPVLALLVAACGGAAATPTPAGGATPTPAGSTAASVTPGPTKAPCPTPTGAALPAASALKIGVVTDVGSLDDKNFNEYTFKGATDAATALGAPAPKSIVPKSASEYAADIQQFVDQKFNIIVTVGFNLASNTADAACANPDIKFLGVDQSPICVDPSGHADGTFACKGDAAKLLPNYTSMWFEEDQPGYLVGIVAASISKSGKIAAIGGTSACAPCIRYIQGYELGAKSVNPAIVVTSKYVVADFSATAFHDPAAGNLFAQQLLAQNPGTDVMFQVAGDTGNGVLQAACTAGIYGIGVDVDAWLSLKADTNPAYQCLVTSAEKHLQLTAAEQIQAIAGGTVKAGDFLYNAALNGIGISAEHDGKGLITPAILAKVDTALAAMKATPPLVTCPAKCGSLK